MAEIGIVIVTYNSGREIGACLDAALRTGAEIAVVDNASADDSAAQAAARGVRVITNKANLGFAAAVNQGIAALDCRSVLLLNPDAVIESTIEPLAAACLEPGYAAAGGKLLDETGVPQAGFMVRNLPDASTLVLEALLLNRLWPGNSVNRRYRVPGFDVSRQQPVEQPAGAFLMVRKEIWAELGGFDEGFYPLWFEDVDFCRRIADRGLRVAYVPSAVAKHTGGHSIPKLPLEMRRFYWYRSFLRYAVKHFRPGTFRAVCLAVVTGSLLRTAGECALRGSLKPLAEYSGVVRLAGRLALSRHAVAVRCLAVKLT
jgi:N-acetylglucosaminyl-diphospho-decaprenol L-rhamnosyltransferase